MYTSRHSREGVIAHHLEWLIDKAYWVSPYRWIDEYYKRREGKTDFGSAEWQVLRYRRYSISEHYILGWLVAGVLAALFAKHLPAWFVLLFLLRVMGILTKELGVLLFGICKITEGRAVATAPRTVILALMNYATIPFLFAFAYQKIDNSAPQITHALIQAFSVSLTFGPAFTPGNDSQWFYVLLQGAVSFLFLGVVISQFVSLIQLETVGALVEKGKKDICPEPPPREAKDHEEGIGGDVGPHI